MTLLCIGQSGQVATALAERAIELDLACACSGRPKTDLLDRASLVRTIREVQPSFVVNAAAYTAVDAAENDRELAQAINVDGAQMLAEICADQNLPLLHLSTDYVFDGTAQRAYLEDDTTAPISVYGATKLASEIAVRRKHLQHIILRTSWVYSPFGNNFIKTMLRLAKEKAGAAVVDDQIGCPTNALDIADAIFTIAQKLSKSSDQTIFGTYHYAGRGECSWADVAALIFETYEQRTGCKIELKRIPTSDYPTPARRPLNSRLDTMKIEQAFGISPKNWTQSVQETVNRLIDEGL